VRTRLNLLRAFALVGVISLKLANLLSDQQVKYAVTVRTAELTVLYKLSITRLAGRTNHMGRHLLFLRLTDSQKSRQQLSKRKLAVKNCGIRTKIQFFRTLGAEMMFRLHSAHDLCILNIGFPHFTAFTQHR